MVILHQYWVFPFSRHWDHEVPAKSISWALRGFRECGIRHEPCPVLPQLCDGGCCSCTSPAPPARGWWTPRHTKPYPSHHRAVFLLRRAEFHTPGKLPGFLLVLRLRRHTPCRAGESEDRPWSTALSPWAARRDQEKSPGSPLAAGDWFWRCPGKHPRSSPAWHSSPAVLQAASQDRAWSEQVGHAGELATTVTNKHFCSEGFS